MAGRTFYIYCHTAPNGKRYVGQTCQRPERRWGEGRGYRGQEHFKRAIDRYGWDNFEHVVLCSVSSKEYADFLEQWFIEKWDTFNPEHGYNHTKGGGGCLGHELSAEGLLRLRQANMGRVLSGDHRKKISTTLKRRYASGELQAVGMSDDARAKMSSDRMGKGNPMYGRHQSDEVRERIGAANRGKKRPTEWKQNISDGRLKSKLIKRCPVCQFTIGGELVNAFESLKDAQEQTGYAASNIGNCCRGKYRQAYGFVWCYQDKPETFPSPVEGLFS